MKTRADLIREAEYTKYGTQNFPGQLALIHAERAALALEGIEDLLRQRQDAPSPTPRFSIETAGPYTNGVVGISGPRLRIVILPFVECAKTGDTTEESSAKQLVELLNKHWVDR